MAARFSPSASIRRHPVLRAPWMVEPNGPCCLLAVCTQGQNSNQECQRWGLGTSCCYVAPPGQAVTDICGVSEKEIFLLHSVC